jgi:TetR/AcrR family transcriptional repressor of nem operon
MKEHGVEAASVEAVMREAGLTVGGFYAHFASKEALAHEAMLTGMETSVARTLAVVGEASDAKAWVRGLIRAYLAQVEDCDLAHACPLTLMLPEVARGGPARRKCLAGRTGAFVWRHAAHNNPGTGIWKSRAARKV